MGRGRGDAAATTAGWVALTPRPHRGCRKSSIDVSRANHVLAVARISAQAITAVLAASKRDVWRGKCEALESAIEAVTRPLDVASRRLCALDEGDLAAANTVFAAWAAKYEAETDAMRLWQEATSRCGNYVVRSAQPRRRSG